MVADDASSGVVSAKSMRLVPRMYDENSSLGWLWFHTSTRLNSLHNLAELDVPPHVSLKSPRMMGMQLGLRCWCVRSNIARSL